MIEQIDIHRQVLVLKKRWPLCLSVFVSVMLLGLIVTVGTPKLYKASANIKVNTDSPEAKFWPAATEYQKISGPQVVVTPGRDNKSVAIDVIHADPKIAADLANQAVSTYLDYQTAQKGEAVKKEENTLNLQLKEAKEKLAVSETKLYDYKVKNQILNQPTLDNQMNRVKHRISLFEEELVKVQALGNRASKEQTLQEAIWKEQEQEMRLEKIISDMVPLKNELESDLKQYNSKLDQVKEMEIKSIGLRPEGVFSVSSAPIPSSLYQPNWKKNAILSLLFALLFSIGIAFILEMFEQRTFRTGEQIEEELQVPFLGLSSSPELRTNLLFMGPDKFFRSLLVTSSKTSLILSTEMAESGNRVLLVDCNFKESSRIPGLSSVVIGESKLDDLIKHSATKNLDLLDSGPRPPVASGLFQTAKFLNILEDLKKRYDTVIFDSSILNLGVQVEGVVLVVEAGVTARESVEKSVQYWRDSHANLLGVVLEDAIKKPRLSFSLFGQFLGRYESKATV